MLGLLASDENSFDKHELADRAGQCLLQVHALFKDLTAVILLYGMLGSPCLQSIPSVHIHRTYATIHRHRVLYASCHIKC